MRCGGLLAATSLAVLAVAGAANGTSLNLGPPTAGPPDIASFFINVYYDPAADLLTASGEAWQLDTHDIVGGTFWLSAAIDDYGHASTGSLAIAGSVADLGYNGTLLTGSLLAFGFPDAGGDPLEFLFSVTGGAAAGLYGGTGAQAGVILTESGFPKPPPTLVRPFANSFGMAYLGTADTKSVVPEPLTGLALVGSLLTLGGYLRRRSRENPGAMQ